MDDLRGKVAVVTGGANGIGKGIVQALLDEGVRVVIADYEQPVLDATVAELSPSGDVTGVVTDVSDYDSVDALAQHVFDAYGACHLLFNNAGVTSGGGGKPWEQEPNDWKWCFGVNVFGVANGVTAFVPRMIASGEPGVIVNTSSGDGGFAPVPYASVYASSKAAVSCFTEALANQLVSEGTQLRAAVFYPSGGLLETGLWSADRNRPAVLARKRPRQAARVVGGLQGGRRQGRRWSGRRRRPARARPLRRRRREGGPLRHRPQHGRGRRDAARPRRQPRPVRAADPRVRPPRRMTAWVPGSVDLR